MKTIAISNFPALANTDDQFVLSPVGTGQQMVICLTSSLFEERAALWPCRVNGSRIKKKTANRRLIASWSIDDLIGSGPLSCIVIKC